MQRELADTSVRIIGVNEVGHETDYNATGGICDGRDLPFLEDTADSVWNTWDVTYRDVYVVDADGKLIEVFNLTDNDLGDDANYASLRKILTDAAQ